MRSTFKTLILCMLLFQSAFAQADVTGMATVYSDSYQNKQTESGEIFDQKKLTAAHASLQFGTLVEVTNTENGKSIVVKINDRLVPLKGESISISKSAANELKMAQQAEVNIRVMGGKAKLYPGKKPVIETAVVEEAPAPEEFETKPAPAPKEEAAAAPVEKEEVIEAPKKKEEPKVIKKKKEKAAVQAGDYNIFKVLVAEHDKTGFGVQYGTYSSAESVLDEIAKLHGQFFKNLLVSTHFGENNEKTYKVIFGPFPDEATASGYKAALKKKGINGFVVNLGEMGETKEK